MRWTKEQTELAVTLWGQGKSATQIAAAMGGVSRNAVIGKLHRLGHTYYDRPSSRPKTMAASVRGFENVPGGKVIRVSSKPPVDAYTHLPEAKPSCTAVQFLDLKDHHCRWPLDDGRFCGELRKFGEVTRHGRVNSSSYCKVHHDLSRRKRDDAAV